MKKTKILSLILTAVILLGTLAMPSFAAPKVGDPIGDVLYTDIVAYIDGHAIRSYNINWNTYIVVEDLLMYGFSVVWNGAEKKLVVYPERTSAPENYTADYTPGKSGGKNGEVAMPYLYTDITTWIGNKKVEAYNIGGFTCMCIDDLAAAFAETYVYDNASRTLKMTSPAFGTGGSKEPSVTPPTINTDALKKAAESKVSDYIDNILAIDSATYTELAKLGAVYGSDVVSEFIEVISGHCEKITWRIASTKVTSTGADVKVIVKSKNLEGILSKVVTSVLTELSTGYANGNTYTDEQISDKLISKLFTEISSSARQYKEYTIDVKVDISASGAAAVDDSAYDAILNAILGGLLNDPLLNS